jgi:hypothetical protein
MEAYVSQRKRDVKRRYSPAAAGYPLEDARERLRGALPELQRWTPLTGVAPLAAADGARRAPVHRPTLSATLEFVREGDLEAPVGHFSKSAAALKGRSPTIAGREYLDVGQRLRSDETPPPTSPQEEVERMLEDAVVCRVNP